MAQIHYLRCRTCVGYMSSTSSNTFAKMSQLCLFKKNIKKNAGHNWDGEQEESNTILQNKKHICALNNNMSKTPFWLLHSGVTINLVLTF